MPQLAVSCALGAWAAAVAGADLYSRRVPNPLLVVLLVPALASLAWNGQGLLGANIMQSLIGALVAGVSLLPGYATGQLGAGDVKFAGSAGLLLGGTGAAELVLTGALLLGCASAVILALRKWSALRVPARIPASPAFAAAFVAQLFLGRVLL